MRVIGSLAVLRWPLGGAILAILVDLSDLLLVDVIDLGGVTDYQRFDKLVDQVYLLAFFVASLRWSGLERRVAVGLFWFRMVGFVAFEITGLRSILLAFPNLFEAWFVFIAAVHRFRPDRRITPRRAIVAGAVLLALKELHEVLLHGLRVFDGIGAIEFLELVADRLTAPFR